MGLLIPLWQNLFFSHTHIFFSLVSGNALTLTSVCRHWAASILPYFPMILICLSGSKHHWRHRPPSQPPIYVISSLICRNLDLCLKGLTRWELWRHRISKQRQVSVDAGQRHFCSNLSCSWFVFQVLSALRALAPLATCLSLCWCWAMSFLP